jgi:hypothetical protein
MDAGGWFYEVGGERKGPMTLGELKALVQAGTVTRETLVFADGMAAPVKAGGLPLLFAPKPDAAMSWLLPVGRSGFAIAAGYLGLFSFIPFVGYLAIVMGVLAIRDLRRNPEKIGWGRVITAFVLGGLFSVVYSLVFFR